jgi:hypothetical protein
MIYVGSAATIFVALEIGLGALDLRHLWPTATSLSFQLLALFGL